MSRCFAFGCSMTNHNWATWADLIGANFNEFYNFARGGGCNTFAANRLLEIDKIANLNPETDYVIVGVTGFNRFTWLTKENRWVSGGDIKTIQQQLYNEPIPPWAHENIPFKDNTWSFNFGVYQSYIAINTIKVLLTSKKIPHKIVMALNNTYYKMYPDILELPGNNVRMVDDIYNIVDVKYSIEEFNKVYNPESIYFKEEKIKDGHPTQQSSYTYVKEYFPEFDTEKTKEFFKQSEKIFVKDSMAKQTDVWSKFCLDKRPYTIRYADKVIGG